MEKVKIMERQFKAIQGTGKDTTKRTVDFVKGGYHYFGNGFQLVKVATEQADKNADQFEVVEVVRSVFEGIEKYENSLAINLGDLYHIFKGLKSSGLCKNGVTLDFDGGGNLTIGNYSNTPVPKIKIRMDYKGDETKYNVLLSVDKVYIILNALRSLKSQKNARIFFDPLNDLRPIMFCDVSNNYEVAQPVMRKF